jgi:hypothetical protein
MIAGTLAAAASVPAAKKSAAAQAVRPFGKLPSFVRAGTTTRHEGNAGAKNAALKARQRSAGRNAGLSATARQRAAGRDAGANGQRVAEV